MKKGIFILSGLMALMLLSFVSPQEKKVVRLKNGNYLVQNLKMDREDVEAIQKQIEELSKLIYKEEDGDIDKKGEKKPKFEDFLAIYESKEGYKAYAVSWNEDDLNVFVNEVHENVITTTLYHDEDESFKNENRARTQERIDAIMNPYLK